MAVAFDMDRGSADAGPGAGTANRRLYAVGDVHGRADLLARLVDRIRADAVSWGGASKPVLIFLGDYIDRGLQSRAVVDAMLDLQEQADFDVHCLKGNHEAALLEFLETPETSAPWLSFGGAETLFSYGVRAPSVSASADDLRAAARAFQAVLPAAHLDFFQKLTLTLQIGGYLFVHAGLRPGKALEAQHEDDLLGIRDAFIDSKKKWPFTIVHGHTPGPAVHMDDRRIGVDTGAYATGRLSVVRLEGDSVRVLST